MELQVLGHNCLSVGSDSAYQVEQALLFRVGLVEEFCCLSLFFLSDGRLAVSGDHHCYQSFKFDQ